MNAFVDLGDALLVVADVGFELGAAVQKATNALAERRTGLVKPADGVPESAGAAPFVTIASAAWMTAVPAAADTSFKWADRFVFTTNAPASRKDAFVEAADALASEGNAFIEPADALASEGDAFVEPADALASEGDAFVEPADALASEGDAFVEPADALASGGSRDRGSGAGRMLSTDS